MSDPNFTGHLIVHVMVDHDHNDKPVIVDLETLVSDLAIIGHDPQMSHCFSDDLDLAADQIVASLKDHVFAAPLDDGDYVMISVFGRLEYYQSGWEMPEWDMSVDLDVTTFAVLSPRAREAVDRQLEIESKPAEPPQNDYYVELVSGNAVILAGKQDA